MSAVCTEFEALLKPYSEAAHRLTLSFQKACDSLPDQWNSTDPDTESAYSRFIGAYGTHYINDNFYFIAGDDTV